jgi:membrane protease YdiL (CAAX protease family)
VLLCLFFFALGVFPGLGMSAFLLFALMPIGFYFRLADVFLLGLMCGLVLFLGRTGMLGGWIFPPLPFAISLAAGLAAGKSFDFTKGAFDWIKPGVLGGRQVLIVGAIALLSAISLVCWYRIVHPDVSDLTKLMPHAGVAVLIAAGGLFSIANAICEEFFWRGAVYASLERALLPGAAVIAIQAASFGMAHLHGFPRGTSGIALATIYGLLLGWVRKSAGGLLAPVLAHVFADLTIFSILVFIAFGK